MDHKDLCEHTKIRLIAAALGHQKCTKTEAYLIPLPGTDRHISVGTADQVRALLPGQALPGIDLDLDKLEALALAYTYENGDHWYCLLQIADGITYGPAANFITGFSPATALALIAQARAAQADEPKVSEYSAGAKAMIGAKMPCGACVTNVYEAYEAGRRAAQAAVPVVGAGEMLKLLQDAARAWNNERESELDATMERIECFLLDSRAAASQAAPAVAIPKDAADAVRIWNSLPDAKVTLAPTQPAGAADTTASDAMKFWDSLPDAKMPEARATLAPVAAQQAKELDHSFDHLAGRGIHELRIDELPTYLSAVAANHGAHSDEFTQAAQWVASELERKTNDERVIAVKLASMRESAAQQAAATQKLDFTNYSAPVIYTNSAAAKAPAAQAVTATGVRHELKTDPEVFASVLAGAKTHEIRKNDRGFAMGDELVLRETSYTGEQMGRGYPLHYTGREVTRAVSHVLTGYGLQDGWCILSLATPASTPEASQQAAAVAAPSEQQANVLPPFAAPAGQQEAITEVLTDDEILDALEHVDPSNYGLPVYAGECVDYIGYDLACARIVEAELTRRFRAQGGNTNGKDCSAGAATTSQDAVARVEIADLESLARKLHEKWGDCLWIDAGELMALEKAIESVRATQQEGGNA